MKTVRLILISLILTTINPVPSYSQFWEGVLYGIGNAMNNYNRQQQYNRNNRNKKSARTPSIERKYHLEDDGFEWYKLSTYDRKFYYGIANSNGNTILDVKYKNVWYYDDVKAFYVECGEGCHAGILSKGGSWIIPLSREYQSISTYYAESGIYTVEKNGYNGVCDLKGNEIIVPNKYESIYYDKNDRIYKVKKNGYEGICDSYGREIIDVDRKYKNVYYAAYGDYYKVEKDGYKGICNSFGKEIIPTIYKNVMLLGEEFKYENDAGEWISLNIDKNGNPTNSENSATYSSASSSQSIPNGQTFDFIFSQWACSSPMKIEFPESGGFKEFVLRFEVGSNKVLMKFCIVDRMDSDKIKILETYNIVPSETMLTETTEMLRLTYKSNGVFKGVTFVPNSKAITLNDEWDSSGKQVKWRHFAPPTPMQQGTINGFNANTNFQHTIAGESDYTGKFTRLRNALKKLTWK
ncbi:MAG: WG repeat-containing protein [Bacteroidaceae bacterium]|nr:WG repeat-containing protein [Bacteroidaceae bacterium]